MIVFDVDGTLLEGEVTDWDSFDDSFLEVAGFELSPEFFASIEEITAQAIVHQALGDLPLADKRLKEKAILEKHLRRLILAHGSNPGCFPAVAGAVALLQDLKARGIPVAIATGDWRETITFKLRAAGIPFEDIPLVTSSEHYSRADIIAAAVAQAGGSLAETVYVGDGLWDLRACRKLGIPFIGTGRRRDKLQLAGALHILEDLTPSNFWRLRESMQR
jgi:phosphoglycolate phosphatase-like HAD superfamily hydrolase